MYAAGDPAGAAAAERALHPRRPLRARRQHQVQARGLPRPRQRPQPAQCRGQDRPRRGQRDSGAASSLAHTGLGLRPQAPGRAQVELQADGSSMQLYSQGACADCSVPGPRAASVPRRVQPACAGESDPCVRGLLQPVPRGGHLQPVHQPLLLLPRLHGVHQVPPPQPTSHSQRPVDTVMCQ